VRKKDAGSRDTLVVRSLEQAEYIHNAEHATRETFRPNATLLENLAIALKKKRARLIDSLSLKFG